MDFLSEEAFRRGEERHVVGTKKRHILTYKSLALDDSDSYINKHGKVRTLKDMSSTEIAALEVQYGCKVLPKTFVAKAPKKQRIVACSTCGKAFARQNVYNTWMGNSKDCASCRGKKQHAKRKGKAYDRTANRL